MLDNIINKLYKLAGKRHKQRYVPKEISKSQLSKKFKVITQNFGDLLALSDKDFGEFIGFKNDLNIIHNRLFEMYKKINNQLL